MKVVSDTSPICYLFLIGHIDLLPSLFNYIFIPEAVCFELKDKGAPAGLRNWVNNPPAWLKVKSENGGRENAATWGTSIGILVDHLFSFFQTRIHESVSAVSSSNWLPDAFHSACSLSAFVGGEFNGAWGLSGCCWEEVSRLRRLVRLWRITRIKGRVESRQ